LKKVFVLTSLILVGVLLAGCLPKKEAPTGEAGTVQQQEQAGEEGFTGKLKDVIARNIPMKCTWSVGDFSATGYVKGEKFYSEVMQKGKQGYMIMKDNCMWTWSKDEAQGVKMCFEPEEGEDVWEMEDVEGMEGAGPPPDVNLKCVPAVISDSKFVPPSNINFMDMSEMMKGMGQPGQLPSQLPGQVGE
jgi:hypothetical protein